MIEQFRGTRDTRSQEITSWTCALGPLPAPVRDWALRHLRDELVGHEPTQSSWWQTLAALYYREGQPVEALRAYQQAVKLDPGSAGFTERLFLALIYHSLERTTDAQRELRSVEAEVESLVAAGEALAKNWDTALECELLHAEARTVILRSSGPKLSE
jgi:predicted Zn-dependent protease